MYIVQYSLSTHKIITMFLNLEGLEYMFYVFKGSKRPELIKTEQNTCTVSRENGQRPLFQINRLFVTVFLFLIIEDCTVKLFNNIINYATLSSEHGDYGKISDLNISFKLFMNTSLLP
jgi:hypothetical protein